MMQDIAMGLRRRAGELDGMAAELCSVADANDALEAVIDNGMDYGTGMESKMPPPRADVIYQVTPRVQLDSIVQMAEQDLRTGKTVLLEYEGQPGKNTLLQPGVKTEIPLP